MLDEIGEMSPAIQAKFLRVLEGHPFERVGGSEPIKVDVRVIAATNRDLEKDGGRRTLPPRSLFPPARGGDHRARRCASGPRTFPSWPSTSCNASSPRPAARFAASRPEAMEQMLRYRWPGNVRELKNVIERAVVLCRRRIHRPRRPDAFEARHGRRHGRRCRGAKPTSSTPLSLADMERRHILATLNATGWNKSQTAAILGHRALDARPQNSPLRAGRVFARPSDITRLAWNEHERCSKTSSLEFSETPVEIRRLEKQYDESSNRA